ncbi:MAG TPA: cytochrome c [Xanthobacteraceae bacterium]|jgi:mono/diheme cytochrome c family protein|nr:cytochrome c [Xanthobacteraceae bacterium]
MRKILLVIVVILILAAAAVWHIFIYGPMAFASGSTVALADYHGANPTGVPASLANADLIKRGKYLTRAADCLVCHTKPGGDRFAGGLAIPLPFGALYSTNITSDKETGIGNYSDAEFLNAVQRGIRRDGTRLYPAMPYTSYTYITDADALAIKAYLFSLPAVHQENRVDTLAFPFNQRWSMAFWSFFLSANARFAPNSGQSPEWNRGAYLAEALAHCGECHTPRNLAFALDNRKKFAGALTAGWHAYNITPDKGSGIGAWSDDQVAAYLSQGHAANHGTAAGPMAEAVDEGMSMMPPEDIHALVTYLRSVPAVASSEPATLAPPAPEAPKAGVVADALGKKVFEQACASCHSWSGESAISPFATITGARAINDPAATNVAQIVISGTQRHTPDGVVSMPSFGSTFSDKEIAAVVNYVTARFGSEKSAVTAKEIADLRKQTSY